MPKENLFVPTGSITDSDKIRVVYADGGSGNELASTIKNYVGEGSIEELVKSRGFNRLAPDQMGVPSYDEETRTFSMSVKDGETYFEFWAQGNRFEKTTTQSVIWSDTSGVYYFYFDTSGVLQYVAERSFSYDDFISVAICGLVHWNSTKQKAIVQAKDEQHGINMPATTHFRLHLRDGAVHMSGGDIVGLTDGEPDYTSISAILSADEDINCMTAETTTAPFIYREGSVDDWVETDTPNINLGHATTGNILYNQESGGVWSLQEVPNNDYVIYYFIWTNDVNNPIKKLVGTQVFGDRNSAREGINSEVGNISKNGFPSTESYFMYAVILSHDGNLEDSGGDNNYLAVDMRGTKNFDIK